MREMEADEGDVLHHRALLAVFHRERLRCLRCRWHEVLHGDGGDKNAAMVRGDAQRELEVLAAQPEVGAMKTPVPRESGA